jgi:hypothetical protein
MKQRIALLTGLTAVSLLILVSCTQPTTPEPTTLPTVVPTSAPTTAPDPTPTPTPTAEEQANQLLLNDGRFTTLFDNLTQEIGRGLSDAEQAQVLALARALWLPGQLDESNWLPDPAGVTLHWRPALDGREGPVLLVEETQPDSPYAAGALIFWQGERLLSLTPGGVGYYFDYGRVQQNGWNFDTWIEYDAEGNIASFVHPDTVQYVTPESEDWRIFTLSDLDDQGNRVNSGLYWQNGGTPTEITTGPGNVPIADYLAANPNLQLTQTEQDSQLMVALEDAETGNILWTLNTETGLWETAVTVEYVGGWGVANGQVYREGDNGPHEDMNEAMSRGGLEPLSVWQDPDTETIFFKVNYEGRELEAELKDRHAGIGRALIVRDVFVSEPNPNMPPASNLRFWNQTLTDGTSIAVIDNPQLVKVTSDWVVFVKPPANISRSGYWQAAFEFRGHTSEGLTYFTVPFRMGFATATRPFIEMDLESLEREFGVNGGFEIGDIWRDIKIAYSVGSGLSRDYYLSHYTGEWYSGGKVQFRLGRYGTGSATPTTFEDVEAAVLSGVIDENNFFPQFVTLPPGK